MRFVMQLIRGFVALHKPAYPIAVVSVVVTHAQISFPSDTLALPPQLWYGLSHIAFTAVFHGDAVVRQPIREGILRLHQQYRGVSLLTGTRSFRDDELLRIEYRYPMGQAIELFPRFEWDVSNDSRGIGISRFERVRLAGGFGYRSASVGSGLYSGFEHTEQLGVRENGNVLGGSVDVSSLNVGEFVADISLQAERVFLTVRRNSDLLFRGVVTYSDLSAISFRMMVEHSRQRRDYYSTLGVSSAVALEHRTQGHWLVGVEYKHDIGWADLSIVPMVRYLEVERYFDQPTLGSTLTYVQRQLLELDASAMATITIHTTVSRHSVNGYIRSRDERNLTAQLFDPPTTVLIEDIRQSERMRDNNSFQLQVSSSHAIAAFTLDTLTFVGSAAIVRYDTPSLLNYDDRDELSFNSRLMYLRHFSTSFQTKVNLEFVAVHFVFLRAQRSALNNWNRALRLGVQCELVLERLRLAPNFEVLAQYTSYDFEGMIGVPTSFSFRQLAFRDSITCTLQPAVILLQYYARWFIRGDFSWQRFAEYPTGSGSEFFIRVFARRMITEAVAIGVGARWYAIEQNVTRSALAVLGSSQQSIAPDIELAVKLDQLELVLSGWYEFRTVSGATQQIIPNIQFNVRRQL